MGVFRALAGVGLAVIAAGVWGCTLDRTGLDYMSIHLGDADDNVLPDGAALDAADDAPGVDAEDDAGAVDAHAGADAAAPDAGADVRPDLKPDVMTDVGVDRGVDARPDVTPDLPPDVAPDLAPDLPRDVQAPIDVTVDVPADLPVDTRPTCNAVCEAGAVLVNPPGGRFTGVTAGPSNSWGSCGGGAAPEAVFHVVLTTTSDLFVTTHGTRFDTVIYVRSGCCGDEIACNDNADGRRTSMLSATALPAGGYDVFIDGATASDAGSFSADIFVSPTSPHAGDSCGRPARIANAALTGTTCGLRDDARPLPGCQGNDDSSFDAIYYFVLDEDATVTFNTCATTCFDTVLYTRDVCTDSVSEQSCNDDGCSGCASSSGSQSRTSAALAAGVHYVVVDTYPGTACGAFTLTPAGVPP